MNMKIRELRKHFVRVIACVSDLHLLSSYAVLPEGLTTPAGNVIGLNDGQRQILGYWNNFCDKMDELEADSVLVGGDIIHGQNPIERGLGLLSTDLDVQVNAGVSIMRRLVTNRKHYWVSGSKYHISTAAHNPEKDICDRLSGTWLGLVANMRILPTEKIMTFSHGGSGSFVYRETAMGREINWAKMSYANDKSPNISMFVHGHWHWFSYLHEYGCHFLQLPCWTAWENSHYFVKNYFKMQPDIGGAVIFVDDEGRIMVWHYLYPLPKITDAVIDFSGQNNRVEPEPAPGAELVPHVEEEIAPCAPLLDLILDLTDEVPPVEV